MNVPHGGGRVPKDRTLLNHRMAVTERERERRASERARERARESERERASERLPCNFLIDSLSPELVMPQLVKIIARSSNLQRAAPPLSARGARALGARTRLLGPPVC